MLWYKVYVTHNQDWHNPEKSKIKFDKKCDIMITWTKASTLFEWTPNQWLVNLEQDV